MARLPRSRVAVAAGLAAGTAVAVLTFGTTAAAAPQGAPASAPALPLTVVAGTPFTVSGSGCHALDAGDPARVAVLTDEAESTDDLAVGVADADGEWSVTLSFPAGTSAGTHEVGAVCRGGGSADSAEFDYPIVAVTVTAAGPPASGTDDADRP
ncbi:hypothetical protein [Modestobacter lapidis]|nr:hypothetical protein [Modestobacter lapidis]